MPAPLGQLSKVYIDESIHDKMGFIVCAFVFSSDDLDDSVRNAIRSVGLAPDVDEFKSGNRMAGDPKMQELRTQLLRVVGEQTKVGLLVTSRQCRSLLGQKCLSCLDVICRKNGFLNFAISAHFDQGILPSSYQKNIREMKSTQLTVHHRENSVLCPGIQVADLVAHSTSQLIRDHLNGNSKKVELDPEIEGTSEATLSWLLLKSLRRALLTRELVYNQADYDRDTDPAVVGSEDDPASLGQHPEMLGWGLHIDETVSDDVYLSTKEVLGKIWLGCMF